MVGAGAHVYAVWGYCISKNRFGIVELNAKLLAFILGEPQERIEAAITFLCAPDPASRTPEEQGRRLLKEGQYQYRMVNWAKYFGLKNADHQREYNRIAQRNHRAKGKPLPGETAYVRGVENGTIDPATGNPLQSIRGSLLLPHGPDS